MAQQTLDLGSIANDGTGDTLRDGGDIINDNFNELYQSLPIDVVRDFGADPTGVADAATAIQNAMDAADVGETARTQVVRFPYGRYKLGSTISLPPTVALVGDSADSTGNDYTRIQWSGATGGQMFLSDDFTNGTNCHSSFSKLHLHGNGTAANIMELNRLDCPMSFIEQCLLTDVSEHAIILQRGCTNGLILNSRWDQVEGFMICSEDGSTGLESTQNLNIVACTGTIGATGNSGLGQGFILLDNEAGGSMSNTINLDGVLLEVNSDPEGWETGQGDRNDALIAVGHNTTYATNTNYYQTSIMSKCVSINFAASYDIAYIKLGTDDDSSVDYIEADFIMCAANNAGATFDWIDNTDTAFGADIDGCMNISFACFSPYQGDSAGAIVRKSYFDTRVEFGPGGRNLVIPVDTSSPSYAQKAGMMYFNTSDSKIYVYTGSAWIATAALT